MTTLDRALLRVDGDHAFALLGSDIQSGEVEFVKVESDALVGTSEWISAASAAATKAYRKLQARLNKPNMTYALDRSHPRAC